VQGQDVAEEIVLPHGKHFNFEDAHRSVRLPFAGIQPGPFADIAISSHADHVEVYKDRCQRLNIAAHPRALSRDNSSNSLAK
jgi:hypothetical protein